MTDLLPERQTIRVPVEDTGRGEDHLYITISSGDLTHEALVKVLGTLGKSKAPVTVNITPEAPPLLMNTQRAAYMLGVPQTYIKALIAAGHLPALYWSESTEKLRTHAAIADLTGNFNGWATVVYYADLVKLVEQARDREYPRLPEVRAWAKPLRRHHKSRGGRSVASLVRQAMKEAIYEGGEKAWVPLHMIVHYVGILNDALPIDERVPGVINATTAGDAIRKQVAAGHAEKRTSPDHKGMYEYRWVFEEPTPEAIALEKAEAYQQAKPAGWVDVSPELPTEERLLLKAIETGDDALKARLRALLDATDEDPEPSPLPIVPTPPKPRKKLRKPPTKKQGQSETPPDLLAELGDSFGLPPTKRTVESRTPEGES